jgi:hypothetical protein
MSPGGKAKPNLVFILADQWRAQSTGYAGNTDAAQAGRIHCVTDISHDFTFYFDGRFGKTYVAQNGIDVRNWGTLHKYDFNNVNLLILQSAASPCAYLPEDIKAVHRFLLEGGGVVVLGEFVGMLHSRYCSAHLTRLMRKPRCTSVFQIFLQKTSHKPIRSTQSASARHEKKVINRQSNSLLSH